MGRKPEKGFEPLTPRLQGACSDQLSYSGDRYIVDARDRGGSSASANRITRSGRRPTMGVASILAKES